MQSDIELFANNPLFYGIDEESLPALLDCLCAQERFFAKDTALLSAGDTVEALGVILSGRIHTVYDDLFGNRRIISTTEPGQLFCDAFCCATDQRSPVRVVAQADSRVTLFEIERILHTCKHACPQHQRLSENLIHILADKYVAQGRKMIHLSERTTLEKLLSYLTEQLRAAGGNPFPVSLNRQELADYLFVDRTGLSSAWNRLKRQGILVAHGDAYALYAEPVAPHVSRAEEARAPVR